MSAFDPKRTSPRRRFSQSFPFTVLYRSQPPGRPYGRFGMFSGAGMKRLATAIAAIPLIGTPAFAADMAVKAPPAPPPVPVYNWTGWYAGVNAGASFGNVKTDFNVAPGTSFVIEGESVSNGTIPGFAGSDTVYPSGFMGGGQIGYNWQLSPIWVVGLEADFQGAIEKDSSTLTSNFSAVPLFFDNGVPSGFDATGTTALNYTAKIEWFGTARARFGYVWGNNGDVLTYVTGGLAYGKVDVAGTSALTGTLPTGVVPFSVTQAFDHSNVNTGWVLGYGTEGRLGTSNWTWKVEGLYMDLGHLDARGPGGSSIIGDCPTPPSGGCFIATAGQVTTHSHFTDGILRGGLNYKFN
jgi:outer membrane immunogenic protein